MKRNMTAAEALTKVFGQRAQRDCTECGYVYVKGNLEDEQVHDKHHKKRLAIVDAQPSPLLATMASKEGVIEVPGCDSATPEWLNDRVYGCAWALAKERRYDSAPWSSVPGTMPRGSEALAFLIVDSDGRQLGAVAFARAEYKDAEFDWQLAWIWLSPLYRRQGITSQLWPYLTNRFGEFYVQPPASEEFDSFLRAHKAWPYNGSI
ncbi:GNAT family N-acetyltransferase [uncultured Photobacterium sp.]|uniref:GNAT family N-acetyltransferase n=1 Tax=uncultured Photobacterium sp. TaxID=173973 RepID=UPI00260DFB18|nr:C2H2-type zinc finger protein [uncultured Photobacterium sp.]